MFTAFSYDSYYKQQAGDTIRFQYLGNFYKAIVLSILKSVHPHTQDEKITSILHVQNPRKTIHIGPQSTRAILIPSNRRMARQLLSEKTLK